MTGPSHDPGSAAGRSGPVPYMIGCPDAALLAELIETLRDDPEVRIRRIVGAPDRPSLLAVEMSPAHAGALRARYGTRLTIEPDSPVELF